jgi:hypothetical protein
MSLVNPGAITLTLFVGGIADLLVSVIVALTLFIRYARSINDEDTPRSGHSFRIGLCLITPILVTIIALIARAQFEQASFFTALYIVLLALFEIFMIVNAVLLFNLFRRLVPARSSVLTVLYGLLTMVGTLLGMTFIGLVWFLILI